MDVSRQLFHSARPLSQSFVIAAMLTLWVAPSAKAGGIYWTEGYHGSAIGRANLDGTGVKDDFITGLGGVNTITVDGTYIYGSWVPVPLGGGVISRANLDGTGVNENFIRPAADGIAVDGTYIYWTFQGSPHAIGRANLDGTGVNETFITLCCKGYPAGLLGGPYAIAVDGTYIYYWLDGNYDGVGIGRANLDGTGVNEQFITPLLHEFPVGNPWGIAVDATHIYFTDEIVVGGNSNQVEYTIGRANLDGTGVNETFIGGIGYGGGVAVDGTHIYWTNPQAHTIGRANLDGTGVNQSFVSLGYEPYGIAISLVDVVLPVQIELDQNGIRLTDPQIQVRIIGSNNVDVTKIDVTTLQFGPNGAAPVSTELVDSSDLIAIFRMQDTGLTFPFENPSGDTTACLQGTIGGQPFNACDAVQVIAAGCENANPGHCGLGFELATILPPLLWLRDRRKRKAAKTTYAAISSQGTATLADEGPTVT